MMKLTHNEKIMWIAGLLEGEGSFSHKGSGTDRNIVIQCHMTDLDVLERLQEYIGRGQINGPYKNGKEHHKQRYMFQLHGLYAYNIMKSILPYMSKRRKQRIEELLTKFDAVIVKNVKNN